MAKRKHRKQADANAQMMVGGVGLAAMQSMFQLVNTQSSLSTSLARSFELSLPLQMQALAGALTQIMLVSECGCCECANSRVAVDIPRNKNADNADGDQFGGIGDMSDLGNLLSKNKGDTTTTTTNNNALDAVVLQSLLNHQTQQLHDQMVDIAGTNQKLAVT